MVMLALAVSACSSDAYDTGDGSLSYMRADFVKAFADHDGKFTAAITDDAQVQQLMGLVGKLVCAKTPQGDMVIGYITSLPKQHDGFLNVFNFTIEQIDYDDEVTL